MASQDLPSGKRLLVSGAGGAAQEQADKRQPDAADKITAQHLYQAQHDEQNAKDVPGTCGDRGRPNQILAPSPQRRAQHPAPVERKGGHEIKDGECPIEVAQIPQNAGDGSRTLRIGDEKAEQQEEQEAEDSALATGRANAIRNSLIALVGSLCISATPPKIKRVMPRIGMPKPCATAAWDISWKTIVENKRPTVATTAIDQ